MTCCCNAMHYARRSGGQSALRALPRGASRCGPRFLPTTLHHNRRGFRIWANWARRSAVCTRIRSRPPPTIIVTDRLRVYSAAMNEIGVADRHEAGRHLNNRAENSHQPFRRRERAMQRFRSMRTLQKFSSSSRPSSKPLRFGTPSRRQTGLQAKTFDRIGRVAGPRGVVDQGERGD
jgi:putative transposase